MDERATTMRRVAAAARRLALTGLAFAAGCAGTPPPPHQPAPAGASLPLEAELRELITRHTADTAEVALALLDLATGDSLLVEAHTSMHAASTMKVPVMLQLFRLVDAGELSLDMPVQVRNEFTSIADGSRYSLSVSDDSEAELYGRIGENMPLRALLEPMITGSSNLATNILIELADPARIEATLAELGASGMRVLRGVEDIPAFERGMNNTTTAYAYLKVLEAIARGRAASPTSNAAMVEILERQTFRDRIPAGLPPGIRVGNKTGEITRIRHDGAIVMPPERPPYVLVVLTRGFTDTAAAARAVAEISAAVYRSVVGN